MAAVPAGASARPLGYRISFSEGAIGPGRSGIAAPPNLEREGAPCFRKLFDIKPGWRTVRAFVCGLGYHELYINGRKPDSRVLEPAQTEYPKRVFYSSYDVTGLLLPGRNSLGMMLGNGWYNQDRVWGGMSYGHPCFAPMSPGGVRRWLAKYGCQR